MTQNFAGIKSIIIKSGTPQQLIKICIVFICVVFFLISIGFPNATRFVVDFINIFILLLICLNNKLIVVIKNPIILLQITLFAMSAIIALFNNVNFFQIVWALRNYIRFLIFFAGCIAFFRFDEFNELLNILEIIFIINFIVLCFQYLQGLRGDYLGGLFGNEKGSNGFLNVFLLVVVSYKFIAYFNKSVNLFNFLLFLIIALAECAICEIKVFYVEIILVFCIVIIFNCIIERNVKTVLKSIMILALCTIVLVVCLQILYILYPNFKDFFSIQKILDILTDESGYSSAGDLNRLTAIGTINELIFKDNLNLKIFGMGLGATEYSSSFEFLTGDFYNEYNYLHYYWFSSAWLYLECGYFGIIIYIGSFICAVIIGLRNLIETGFNPLIILGIVIGIMVPILFIYNQCLRLEIAFLIYFCLAMIFVGDKKHVK